MLCEVDKGLGLERGLGRDDWELRWGMMYIGVFGWMGRWMDELLFFLLLSSLLFFFAGREDWG